MFVLIMIVDLIYTVAVALLFARAILSWVRPDPYHKIWGPVSRFVYQATEPVLAPIRRRLPPSGGMDFSPLIVWVILWFVREMLLSALL